MSSALRGYGAAMITGGLRSRVQSAEQSKGAVRRRALAATLGMVASTILVAAAPTSAAGTPKVVGFDVDGRALSGRAAALAPLQAASGGTAQIAADGIGGSVTFVGAAPGRTLTQSNDTDPGQIARRFLSLYGTSFGVDDPSRDLVEERRTNSLTGVAVRFRQEYEGIPVLAGTVSVAVAEGAVTSAAGETVPLSGVDTTATITAAQAEATAIALTARDADVAANLLTAAPAELWVYDPALLDAPGLPGARLVWRTAVRTQLGDVDQFVLIDAHDGTVALQFSQVHAAEHREVCDNNNTTASETCTSPVLVEGGNVGAQNVEVQNAYNYSGDTYDYYFDILGRDSIDDLGMDLISTVRFCPPGDCPYANAFWNGEQMVYGDTYAGALDVVGHELTHGVTEYTSGLIYFGQSGAINESLSDVFGEIVQLANLAPGDADQTDWLMGEDLPIGAIRSMSDPTDFADPDKMTSANYWTSTLDFYGVHMNSGVNNKAAYLIAKGGVFNGYDMGAGIGIDKTAKVYYQAQTTLLHEGSDYLDLFHVLPQACNALIGNGLTAANCAIVNKAVLATEMNKAPTSAAVNKLLPRCPAGQVVSNLVYIEEFDASPNWDTAESHFSAQFALHTVKSDANALFGPDAPVTATARAYMLDPIVVPATGTTYVQFTHAFQFDAYGGQYYDGGRVRYSTTGATGSYSDLTSISGASTVNGYNATITNYSGTTNPWAGGSAFSAESPGFQTTQINISSLASQSINVGFFTATDDTVGYGGWMIDDIAVYQCSVGSNGFTPITPCRLLSTLEAPYTVGPRDTPLAAGETLTASVIGTNGDCTIPTSATSVSMNVTVVGAQAPGYVTVFPCDADQPNASSLNYSGGQAIPNAVISKIAVDGTLCFYTLAATNLIVDINGYYPEGSGYVPLVPARLMDTRSGVGIDTVDGRYLGAGVRSGNTSTSVMMLARGGVPVDATAVVLNVTVTGAQGPGFVTVFPCDATRPTASNLNYDTGDTIPNAVISKIAADGTVCFYTWAGTHLVVDVTGYYPANSGFTPVVPARLLETRDDLTTIDDLHNGVGMLDAGDTYILPVTGRSGAGVPGGSAAVVLNVTVTGAQGPGFVTVYPCDAPQPTASNLNYGTGDTIPNAVITKLSATGTVCLYTLTGTHLVVDVAGYFTTV